MPDVPIRRIADVLDRSIEWERSGSCGPDECQGQCCRFAMVFLQPDQLDDAMREFYEVRGFEITNLAGELISVKIDSVCPYLDDSGRCSIYEKRPTVCREYPSKPMELLGLPRPCGFTFSRVS